VTKKYSRAAHWFDLDPAEHQTIRSSVNLVPWDERGNMCDGSAEQSPMKRAWKTVCTMHRLQKHTFFDLAATSKKQTLVLSKYVHNTTWTDRIGIGQEIFTTNHFDKK